MISKSIQDAIFYKTPFKRNGTAEAALGLGDGLTDPCGALQLCNKKAVIPTTSNRHKTAFESRSCYTYAWTFSSRHVQSQVIMQHTQLTVPCC